MIFEGKVNAPVAGERHWEVRIPQLGIFTQGKTEADGYAMAADAIETVIDEKGFRARIVPLGKGRFAVQADDSRPLIARWLYRLRTDKGLSLREVAGRLGSKSSEAWARYESGRASPTVEKLSELVQAVEPGADFVLKKVVLRA